MFKKNVIRMTIILLMVIFGFSSCTKNSEEISENNKETINKATVPVREDDFNETDEDLLKVDYKEFYDELAPHGEWVQVSADDIGIDLKNGEGAGTGESGSILDDLIGVKSAYADDFGFGMFFVWRPNPNLAVSVVAGEPPVYVPYVNGSWVYTDAGWYFRAPTYYEEITHHYGRWVWHPVMGWVWIPGRVWAPAWVEWRVSTAYIAWAPLPPSIYIVNHVVRPIIIHEDRFICVEKRHFFKPHVYKHSFMYKDRKHKIKIHELVRPDGIMVVDRKVINKGPEISEIEKISGRNFHPVKINKTSDKKDVKYSDNNFNVYSPRFNKVKESEKLNKPVSKPNNFTTKDNFDRKERNFSDNNTRQDRNEKDKDFNWNLKGSENSYSQDKQNRKSSKELGDDRGMKNEKKMREYNEKSIDKGSREYKERKNEKGNYEYKNKGNEKMKKQDRDKSKPMRNEGYKQKSNGNNKTYKEKGNDRKFKQDNGNRKPVRKEDYKRSGKEKNKNFRQKSSKDNNKTDYKGKGNHREGKDSKNNNGKNRRK